MGAEGKYRELDVTRINEGQVVDDLNVEIRRAATKLMSIWERSGSRKGSASVTLKINISPTKGVDDHATITYHVGSKVPALSESSLAKIAGGRLLTDLEGSRHDTPEQIQLFYGTGAIAGTLDIGSGEFTEPEEVAGKIKNTG